MGRWRGSRRRRPIVRRSTLTLTKTADVSSVSPGGKVTWTLVVANTGPSDAATVAVADVLPPQTTFVAEGSSPACAPTGPDVVSCAVGDLPAGHEATLRIVTAVGSQADGTLVNNATATATGAPAVTDNASVTVSTGPHGPDGGAGTPDGTHEPPGELATTGPRGLIALLLAGLALLATGAAAKLVARSRRQP